MDADDLTMIRDAADGLLAGMCDHKLAEQAEAGEWPTKLWNSVVNAGLTTAAVAEAHGGAGMVIGDALLLAGIAAEHAAPIPLGETIVAAWLLDRSGLTMPTGPLAFTVFDGVGVMRVPWGRRVTLVAIIEGQDGASIAVASPTVRATSGNMAGEPRDDVTLSAQDFATGVPSPVSAADLRMIGAALRSVQIAGALRRAVRLATDYARQRVQFGRSLSQFQAIQQSLAVLATQASVATAAAEMATRAVTEGTMFPAVAVAKARCGEAAGIGSAIAHQIHGAIGFTREHELQRVTRRLLSWRDEYGNESEWNRAVGRHLAATGADALWHHVTEI